MNVNEALLTYLAIGPQSSEEMVLRLLIELGAQVVDAHEGSLLIHDKEKGDLVFAMTVGGGGLVGQRVPMNKGLTGLAAATREVQIGAPTFHLAGEGKPESKASGPKTPQAVIAAPMLVADELVGVLTAVSFDETRRFTSKDGELYGRLAAMAGVVVQQRLCIRTLSQAKKDALAEKSEVERSIEGSLSRLGRSGPDALALVARLLRDVEGLVFRRSMES